MVENERTVNMDRKFEHILLSRFSRMRAEEVMQEIRIAEFLAGDRGKALAFSIASKNLIDAARKQVRLEKRFKSLFCFVDEETGEFGFPVEDGLLAWMEEEEWSETFANLPYPARKLAKIAEQEAGYFFLDGSNGWNRNKVMELRGRIKRRFVEWDRDHSVWNYGRARKALLRALRRRSKGGHL